MSNGAAALLRNRVRWVPGSRRVAVVGGGVLGVTTALLLAEGGTAVTLFERREVLWSGATAANEGKVHLGPVYALGTERTWSVMIEAALAFGGLLERAVGTPIDWPSLTSDTFAYIVMPTSLAPAEELQRRYAAINRQFRSSVERCGGNYLGRPIVDVIDEQLMVDAVTGLPTFCSRERSVDPSRLGALLVDAVERHALIDVRVGTRVRSAAPAEDGVILTVGESGVESLRFDAMVNCAWEGRSGLMVDAVASGPTQFNYRVKVAATLQSPHPVPSVTLVHGPFGDVVDYGDRLYASWYPVGRVAHEAGMAPSAELLAMVDSDDLHANAEQQVAALKGIGVLPESAACVDAVAGVIIGDGALDIDDPRSELHHREHFTVIRDGRIITPLNYKFSTAPLAAARAADLVSALLHA